MNRRDAIKAVAVAPFAVLIPRSADDYEPEEERRVQRFEDEQWVDIPWKHIRVDDVIRVEYTEADGLRVWGDKTYVVERVTHDELGTIQVKPVELEA